MLLFRYAIWILTKFVLSLRYRVQIHGVEQLGAQSGPVLILPNHPSYTEPVLVLTALWSRLRPRPVLYEEFFRHPLLYPIAKLLRAVRVPDLEHASVRARQRTTQ